MTEPALVTGGTVELTEDEAMSNAWAQLRKATVARQAAQSAEELARALFDELIGDCDKITASGQELAVYRHDGRFSGKKFTDDLPHLAARYTKWRAESYLDEDALKIDHPMLFEQYRARTLRPIGGSR